MPDPIIEATLHLSCGHTTVTSDRRAIRAQEAVNDGRVHPTAHCPELLCRMDRTIVKIDDVHEVPPKPEPSENDGDWEREIVQWEAEQGYREGTADSPGRMKPEFVGKHRQPGWGYDPR